MLATVNREADDERQAESPGSEKTCPRSELGPEDAGTDLLHHRYITESVVQKDSEEGFLRK